MWSLNFTIFLCILAVTVPAAIAFCVWSIYGQASVRVRGIVLIVCTVVAGLAGSSRLLPPDQASLLPWVVCSILALAGFSIYLLYRLEWFIQQREADDALLLNLEDVVGHMTSVGCDCETAAHHFNLSPARVRLLRNIVLTVNVFSP